MHAPAPQVPGAADALVCALTLHRRFRRTHTDTGRYTQGATGATGVGTTHLGSRSHSCCCYCQTRSQPCHRRSWCCCCCCTYEMMCPSLSLQQLCCDDDGWVCGAAIWRRRGMVGTGVRAQAGERAHISWRAVRHHRGGVSAAAPAPLCAHVQRGPGNCSASLFAPRAPASPATGTGPGPSLDCPSNPVSY